MKKFINKVKGFTLTELAIVIAVIAILIAVLVPTFISLINSANESRDTQMIYNVNNALSVESASNAIETPAKALDVAEKAGYKIENLTPTSDSEIYYDQENVRFIIVYSDGTRYPSSAEDTDLNSPTVWRFVDEATYQSILAQDTSSATVQSSKAATKTAVKAEDVASATVTHTVSYIAKGEWTTSFDYTGMGGVDTTRATGITQVNYTIQVVENTTYSINPIYSVSDEVQKVAVVSAVAGEISVKKSCGQNTYTTVVAAEGVTCSLTFEAAADDSSPVLYDTSSITVIVTQNGEDVTEDVTESIDLAKTADFSTGVLELGTVKYPYLIASEDDYDKINNGGYCQVTSNITNTSKTLTVDAGVTAIIDLNNNTITSSNSKTISVASGATLTINGSGTITSSGQSYYAIYNQGTLTLNNVTISGKGYGVYSKATSAKVIINGGTITSTGNHSVYNAVQDESSEVTVEVNNADIETTGSLKNAIYNDSGTVTIKGVNTKLYSKTGAAINSTKTNSKYSTATININAGTITSDKKYAICVVKGTTINMTGGTVESKATDANATTCGISLASATSYLYASELNISGGEVISNASYAIYVNGRDATEAKVNISGTASIISKATNSSYYAGVLNKKGVVNISGGTITSENGVGIYNSAPASSTSADNELNISDGTISGYRGIENLCVMIMTGGTVVGEEIAVYIAEGTAGKLTTISGSAVVKAESTSKEIWSYGIRIDSGMALSISEKAAITATNAAGATAGIFCVGSGDSSKYTTMTISGGTISGDAYGITGNGSNAYTDVTISGGSISGDTAGYYHPEEGTLTISGGSITGKYAGLQICAGTITISDGTFTATATSDDISGSSANVTNKTGDGVICDGAALSIINRSGYGTYTSTGSSITKVTVTGGTFISCEGNSAIQSYTFTAANADTSWTDVESYVTISNVTY